ncbi:uncharacterized protein BcabD6B2_36490 [Babesia caballi]|uniref:Uncharacterized protein n=1 Tax=Babesia caballi TaxID=5871 RepID=A0AAV4M0A3_BABCB|nr:hypothetical protein, conserved [Babesia caballi]
MRFSRVITPLVVAALAHLHSSAVVYGLLPGDKASSPDKPDSFYEYEDEADVLGPMNAMGALTLNDQMPPEISGIEETAQQHSAKGGKERKNSKIVEPKLLEDADRAMKYVNRIYNRMEKYNHMYAGKSEELSLILDRYAFMLSRMVENKKRIKHLSFIRRYLIHVTKVKAGVTSTEHARSNLMSQAATIYNTTKDIHATIKLDFERYYTVPDVVIDTSVSSLKRIGEAYKQLASLHKQMFAATEAFRTSLNRMRASSVYMFSYLLCLDILHTEILPLRMEATQDLIGTTGTGDIAESYHTNILNKRNAIHALLKNAVLEQETLQKVATIYTEVQELAKRSKELRKSNASLAERIEKNGRQELDRRIGRVEHGWNEHYKRPVLMCKKLTQEYAKLSAMAAKIKEELAYVHGNKQSLYTMSTRCNELYSMARELVGLGKDGARPRGTGDKFGTAGTATASTGTQPSAPTREDSGSSNYKESPNRGPPRPPVPARRTSIRNGGDSEGTGANYVQGYSSDSDTEDDDGDSQYESIPSADQMYPHLRPSHKNRRRFSDASTVADGFRDATAQAGSADASWGPRNAAGGNRRYGFKYPLLSVTDRSSSTEDSTFDQVPSRPKQRRRNNVGVQRSSEGAPSTSDASTDTDDGDTDDSSTTRRTDAQDASLTQELEDLAQLLAEAKERLHYYHDAILALRWEPESVPGAREAKQISYELHQISLVNGTYVLDYRARQAMSGN